MDWFESPDGDYLRIIAKETNDHLTIILGWMSELVQWVNQTGQPTRAALCSAIKNITESSLAK